jgi:hypothetical protein
MWHEGRSPPIADFINGIGQKRKGSQRAYSVRIGSKADIIDAFWHFPPAQALQ